MMQRSGPYAPALGAGPTAAEPPTPAAVSSDELDGMLRSLTRDVGEVAPDTPSPFGTPTKSPAKYGRRAPTDAPAPAPAAPDLDGMLRSLMTELRRNKLETGETAWPGITPSTLPPLDFLAAHVAPGTDAAGDDLLAQLDALGDALEGSGAPSQHVAATPPPLPPPAP